MRIRGGLCLPFGIIGAWKPHAPLLYNFVRNDEKLRTRMLTENSDNKPKRRRELT
nr:MAG TPA: hypothetical protein [Caudoviricetes sp.]